jgi:hypothetical protein
MDKLPSPDGIVDAQPDASLSDVQLVALEALCQKKTEKDAAEAAGVDPRTVRRWLKTNAHFKAAYNSWLRDISDTAHSHILAIYDEAAHVVAESVRQKNVASARMVLKDMPKPSTARPCTPEAVAKEMELDRRAEELRLQERAENLKDIETSHFIRRNDRKRQKWLVDMQQAVDKQNSA